MRRPVRDQEQDFQTGWEQPRRPADIAVRTAGTAVHAIRRLPLALRRAVRSVAAEVAVAVLVAAALAAIHHASVMQLSPPSPPAHVCGSSSLNGPSSPPGGATTVPAGDNSAFSFSAPNTTYWFAAGTHTLGNGQFSQITAGANSVYEGAPGAVLDGQGINQFAFGGFASGVTVEYLTIQNFHPPGGQGAVNDNGEPGWTIQYDTVAYNVPGPGIQVGTNNVISNDCLTQDGEYGFNAYTINDVSAETGGPSNITMTGNEISNNDTCNWEVVPAQFWPYPTPPAGCTGAGQFNGCGCSGAGKLWEADTGTFSNNWVHDNYATGAWWDTNDTGWTITNNYFSDNWGTGLTYEIAYNADISNNVFVRNGIPLGPANPDFPTSAIYISESGSDPRVPGAYGSQFAITDNQFYDNWGGVVLWENSNRYCTSIANTSTGTCTLVNPSVANLTTCDAQPVPIPPSGPVRGPRAPSSRRGRPGAGSGHGQSFVTLIQNQPWFSDCRWRTQNVNVSGNLFDFTPSQVDPVNCNAASTCGFNATFSIYGTIYPYYAYGVGNNVTFNQGNTFTDNTYCGPWGFVVVNQGSQINYPTWQAAPYNQDAGSTLDSAACTPATTTPPAPPRPAQQNRTVTIPIRIGRR